MTTPAQFDELQIVNQALTRMGEDELSDFRAGTAKPARIMRQNYDQVKELALTKTSWRFASVKTALNKHSGVPINRWSAAWSLPVDRLKVLFVWPANNYEIQGKRLFSNNTSAQEIDYIRWIPEGEWPAWFREYVITSLIVKTVKGITGAKPSTEQRNERTTAENTALSTDSAQQPNPEPLPSPFIDVRF